MNEEKIKVYLVEKLHGELIKAIMEVIMQPEYDIRCITLALSSAYASFICGIMPTNKIEEIREISKNIGKTIEFQMLTNYTGDPDAQP